MSFETTLSSNIAERTGLTAAALSPNDDASLTDPLPAILPPEGVTATKLGDVVQAVLQRNAKRVDVSGVHGCAGHALAAALANEATTPVVVVVPDAESAQRCAEDLAFFLRNLDDEARENADSTEDTGAGSVLLLTVPESSPYADVNSDRRGAMGRMATLAHLAMGLPWRVLVVPVAALARKFPPRAALQASTQRIVAEDELHRDDLLQHLGQGGYLRVPIVEDPGSFAVRGALLDLWPPNTPHPVRIELYGDLVVSIKPFDPHEQRTLKDKDAECLLQDVWVPPVREAILSPSNIARARDRVQQLAEMIDWPTSKTRPLVDDVATGRSFFGADGYLPAYYDQLDTLFDYLTDRVFFVLDDPPSLTAQLRAELERCERDGAAKASTPSFLPASFFADEASVANQLQSETTLVLHRTPIAGVGGDGLDVFEACEHSLDLASRDQDELSRALKTARSTKGKTGSLGPLVRRIAHFQDHGLRVFLAARTQTQGERLVALLKHQGLRCRARFASFDPAWLDDTSAREEAHVVLGHLTQGVLLPADGLAIITEEEIFGSRAHRKRERKASPSKSKAFLEDLRALEVGDFVVHAEHGIGRYQGLVHREVAGHMVDLLVVEYAGGDKLYLPVYRLNQIQKYSGGESTAPKVDRLGGSTFSKTKARVQKEIRQMADELLKLYAEREAQPGFAFPSVDDDYRAFEATFPFEETPDQAKAIDEVNGDLEKAKPMDRLVCGDVGFGKTEVALRAAFRVALSGKQVCVLCPTTVLAQQHFRTFESRIREYPVTVRALSRFQSKKESTEVLSGIKDGRVDIVIGTHRLLSKDIHFKDLGLLIVDEEQRFGVAHKERMKQLRAQVDVLTLSATPIPRTLQMAVSGLRDLSLITTAPVDRRAVRTIVTRFDETVLKEAVQRELSRGGQVFYVYNRVEGLYEKAQKLQNLVPQARIAVAHGQMAKGSKDGEGGALEQTMLDFVEGRYDILCATAIVESGLDIPRANTIIIDRADLFGLAQLYQLRGRVGRSKERAYCYLVVPPPNAMTDESRARIEALERHTALGSGFQIASLDMELRGAGDLLGAEQSGTVTSVGLDLFCQMLDEAVRELRGEVIVHDVDPELSFDVSALLPEDYVSDVGIRLSLYKRLASAIDEQAVMDLAEEMENRFGPPPDDARHLVQLMVLKTELRRLKVLGCEAHGRSVTLHLRDDTPLDPKKILDLVRAPRSVYKLTPDMRLTRRFETEANGIANAETLLGELAKCLKADH